MNICFFLLVAGDFFNALLTDNFIFRNISVPNIFYGDWYPVIAKEKYEPF
jgi:hypothetical protein